MRIKKRTIDLENTDIPYPLNCTPGVWRAAYGRSYRRRRLSGRRTVQETTGVCIVSSRHDGSVDRSTDRCGMLAGSIGEVVIVEHHSVTTLLSIMVGLLIVHTRSYYFETIDDKTMSLPFERHF